VHKTASTASLEPIAAYLDPVIRKDGCTVHGAGQHAAGGAAYGGALSVLLQGATLPKRFSITSSPETSIATLFGIGCEALRRRSSA